MLGVATVIEAASATRHVVRIQSTGIHRSLIDKFEECERIFVSAHAVCEQRVAHLFQNVFGTSATANRRSHHSRSSGAAGAPEDEPERSGEAMIGTSLINPLRK